MSFLNPVSEPVLRFSSTDADAPQINYAARTAGDVKAVLKACLVTGYGTTDSAGWSVVNEAGDVAEFVSPSAAMSDYRFGVGDSDAANTVWYYTYNDVSVTPDNNKARRNLAYIDKSHAANGWELLVSDIGMYFVEMAYLPAINNTICRITWMGSVKLAVTATQENMSFFTAGYYNGVNAGYPSYTLSGSGYKHYRVAGYSDVSFSAANLGWLSAGNTEVNNSLVDVVSPVYLCYRTTFVGQQPGMMLLAANNIESKYGVTIDSVDGRPVMRVGVTPSTSSAAEISKHTRFMLLRLDTWES